MTSDAFSAETILGLERTHPISPFELFRAVRGGLPIAALEHLAKVMAPDDSAFKYRVVPKATLARRRKSDARLNANEGDRLARVAKVFGMALEIYGAPEGARNFMRRAHPMLEGATPLDVVLAADPG